MEPSRELARGECGTMIHRRFGYRGALLDLRIQPEGHGHRVALPDGVEHRIETRRISGQEVEVSRPASSQSFRAIVAVTTRGIEVAWNGDVFVFEQEAQRRVSPSKIRSSGAVASPMPGIVVDVLVSPGDVVEAYQPLAVVEAMKVMATLDAPFAGTVAAVNTSQGARVSQGDILVEISPAPDS
jgi:biotin carboxyl carrier protein